jgi:hypothetical protein
VPASQLRNERQSQSLQRMGHLEEGKLSLKMYRKHNSIIVRPADILLQHLSLESFSKNYKAWGLARQDQGCLRRVKIAILCNGVFAPKPRDSPAGLPECLISGVTVIPDSLDHAAVSEDQWWLSTDPLGTQMLDIITAVDPFCEVYVIKIGAEEFDTRILAKVELSRSKSKASANLS